MTKLLAKILMVWVIMDAPWAYAQVQKDIPNTSDYALMGRYPGSFISGYTFNEYDRFYYPTQTMKYPKTDEFKAAFKRVEGKRTTIIYDIPTTTTTSLLKVFRSIEQNFVKSGFETILSCGVDEGCGTNYNSYIPFSAAPYAKFDNFAVLGNSNMFVYVGVLKRSEGNLYIMSYVGRSVHSRYINYSYDILQEESFTSESMVLNVNDMEQSLTSVGRVELGGLYFESDRTELTPASAPSLEIIVQYLKAHPTSTYLIVGHTDTEGGFDYNLKLSKDRADAVAAALKAQVSAGIAKNLSATGVGYAAPAATNLTDAGKTKNRRVELVLIEQ